MKVEIKPIIKSMNFAEVSNISVVIDSTGQVGNRAQVSVRLSGDISETKFVDLSVEEYAAWGDDDSYITNLAISKLGLERA